MDTTIGVYNASLHALVTSEGLLSWQRVRLCNMLAYSGSEWYECYRQHNAGMFCCIPARLCVVKKSDMRLKARSFKFSKVLSLFLLYCLRSA